VTGGAYDAMPDLDLRLYVDGYNDGNRPGYDPIVGNRDDDYLLASSSSENGNVELLDFSLDAFLSLGSLPATYRPNFYLEVRNFGVVPITYGLAVTLSPTPVPEPAALGMLAIFSFVLVCPKRRRMRSCVAI
jgi:hypothetical protein